MHKNGKIIELINVKKVYENTEAVKDLNFYIGKGEFITLLGPSGCGKSTTLRLIAGFELPTEGRILLNGKDITDLPPYERPVNTVFQRYALFPHLNVYDNIAFGLKLQRYKNTYEKDGKTITKIEKLSKAEIDKKVSKVLKLVDLEGYEKRDVSTLSGGQQQRIAIARAIVNEPQILLLDEPLGALDLKMRKDMQLELKAMHEKLGITFIYVTHDQEEALTMSDTIIVMKDGTVQQIGTPKGIYNEPKNAFVADFIGESNIYSGFMTGDKKVKFLGKEFECVDDFPLNSSVDVVVRPEDVVLSDEGKGAVDGTIISSIFKGVHYEMTMSVGKSEVLIQDTVERKVGEKCSITISPDNIHIMEKSITVNRYDGYITKKNTVCFAGGEFECDVTQLYAGSHLDDDGYLITTSGEKLDLTDTDVVAEVDLKHIEILDDEEGVIAGNIVQIVYKGDHYQVVIRTDEEEDFVCDTEYAWNVNDRVSVSVPKGHIKLKLKAVQKNDRT